MKSILKTTAAIIPNNLLKIIIIFVLKISRILFVFVFEKYFLKKLIF